ncbi:MAG: hypothetical protein CL942_08720 [Desulfovibrio sp.]|nr:hypothetical protein [Desulfovibrio sp.]|tara:strand:+ start:84 stop:518 length:435 start_codon:yes stop_codon:yes gene_type:complete
MNVKCKKGIMPARPLCFGSHAINEKNERRTCMETCEHEFECFHGSTMLAPSDLELAQALNRVLLRENGQLAALVHTGRMRDIEVIGWLAEICERNDTHVDSIDSSDMPIEDVSLGDLRGLCLTAHSVIFAQGRMKRAARIIPRS